MRSQMSTFRTQATTLSSLYTSGQCFLSVLGSIGVILLFAGIPQIIYAAHVNPTNLLTFSLGAMLVMLMVVGNAFIGHKYRQLIRSRREHDRPHGNAASLRDDKPPSYDELVKQDGLPPEYEVAIQDKPPIYSELVHEVINWEAISSSPYNASCSISCKSDEETPILVPVHRELEQHRAIGSSSSQSLVKDPTSSHNVASSKCKPRHLSEVSSQFENGDTVPRIETVSSFVKFIEPGAPKCPDYESANSFIEIHIQDEETFF